MTLRPRLKCLVMASLPALVVWALSTALHADVYAEFRQIKDRFSEQLASNRLSEAEGTATLLRRYADGPLSNVPEAMELAVTAQALVLSGQGRFAAAEPLMSWLVEAAEKNHGPASLDLAQALRQLSTLYVELGRNKEAETPARRSVAIAERMGEPGQADLAFSLNALGLACMKNARYAEAEPLFTRSAGICERLLGPEDQNVATILTNLSYVYTAQGRYPEVEQVSGRALAIFEKLYGPRNSRLLSTLNELALASFHRDRYADAESYWKRFLAISRESLGPEHPQTVLGINNLAGLYMKQGRNAEAVPLYQQSIALSDRTLGPAHPSTALSLSNLGMLYENMGRHADAERALTRSLAIREKVLGPEHPDTAYSLNNLASLYHRLGRYAEAEPLLRRALTVWEKALGSEHDMVATALSNLGMLHMTQARYAEAEPLLSRAVAISEKCLGLEHSNLGERVNNQALAYTYTGRLAEGESAAKRAVEIWKKALGSEHPRVAIGLANLGCFCEMKGRYAEAESFYKEAQAISEKALGPDHSEVGTTLIALARLDARQGNYQQAASLLDRAVKIFEHSGIQSADCCGAYVDRAQAAWKLGRRDPALADLHKAMDVAEQQRGRSTGAGHERAQYFQLFASAFERMVACQMELGDAAEALAAIERSRARSLLDEMSLVGADLHVGRPPGEREEIRQQEAALRSRVASLERQFDAAMQAATEGQAVSQAEKARLQSSLAAARRAVYEHYRDTRSSSPVYRRLVNVGSGSSQLQRLRSGILANGGLLLVYVFGQEGGYVVVIGPDRVRLAALRVEPAVAKVLDAEPGPLTASRLEGILINQRNSGVVQLLVDPKKSATAEPKLAALWQLLVPEAERVDLIGGKVARLIVVPDGPLALLPFEVLVAKPGDPPQYLLDAGPPILYAPSASVLCNLGERPKSESAADREPVLTVGDPNYPADAGASASAGNTASDQLAARSRYRAVGGKLTQLPFSGWESNWVAETFAAGNVKSASLAGELATEANVRTQIAGRRIVHLACHGLADQSYGNFFGGLALTPGPDPDNPADDGFLTLPEIYELDLKDCALAILSACQTNYGPQQRGEGVWTLSRGFLVAGARRVVASNWLVDDEAAATLISYFCAGLAAAKKEGRTVDFAESLQKAKRLTRQQEKWRDPYYWGTFVLVGPN